MQPLDETPLPGYGTPAPMPAVAASVPPMAAEITAARAAVVDAARTLATSLSDQLLGAKAGIVSQASLQAADLVSQLGSAYGEVGQGVDKVGKWVQKRIGDAETGLWEQQVVTPVTLQERAADLSAGDYSAFAQRYAQSILGPPAIAGGQPAGGEPPPGVPLLPPPTVPPVPPTCWYDQGVFPLVSDGCPSRVASQGSDGCWGCEVGYTLARTPSGKTVCVLSQNLGGCIIDPPTSPPPISPPPTSPPPTSPPPTSPPPGTPPPTPPPPPTPIDPCNPPTGPAVQIDCYQLPPPIIPWVYYVTLDCTDCARPKACVWQGVNPPAGYTGTLVAQTWTRPPSQAELQQLVQACAVPPPGVPPTSPPPGTPPTSPPPGVPPTSPPLACSGLEEISLADLVADEVENCPPPDDGDAAGGPAASPGPGGVADSSSAPAGPGTPVRYSSLSWGNYLNCTTSHSNQIARYERSTPKQDIDRSGLFRQLTSELTEIGKDLLDSTQSATTSIVNGLSGSHVPNKKSAVLIGSGLAWADRIQRVTGFPLDYLMMGETYLFQYANPQFIPGQSELNRLYYHDIINQETWTCYTKANGNITNLASLMLDAERARPTIGDVVQLYNRGLITTKTDLVKRLRKEGVYNESDVDEFVSLSEWLPQPGDILRYMVRDVFDPNVVAKYGLDDEFVDKYPGTAQTMGKAVGLQPSTAQMEWRAHWRIPSDTALYAMVQRLYAGRQEVRDWDDLKSDKGEAEAIAFYGPRPPVFTTADLKTALKINDNLPSFVDSLVAIQYRPITNTDASRMFLQGRLTKDQLADRIRQNGYTADNAEVLSDFYDAERVKRIANDTGVWSARKIIQAFKDGLLSEEKARELLTGIIRNDDIVVQTLNRATQERTVESQRIAVKSLKKRYLLGEWDADTLEGKLQFMGMEQSAIAETVERWTYEREGRAKEPRVTMLCQWRDAGLITVEDHYARLIRLGYNTDDAGRISQMCETSNVLKRNKAAAAAAEKQRRDAERQLRQVKENLQGAITVLTQELAMLQGQVNYARSLLPA